MTSSGRHWLLGEGRHELSVLISVAEKAYKDVIYSLHSACFPRCVSCLAVTVVAKMYTMFSNKKTFISKYRPNLTSL